MKRFRERSAAAAVAVCFALTLAAASDAAKKENVDAQTEAVVRKLSDYFRKAKTLSLTVNRAYQVTGDGLKSEASYVYNIAVARPNRINLAMKSGAQGVTVVCDGKKFYIHMHGRDAYGVEDAPGSLDELFELPLFTRVVGPLFMHDVLLREDPYEQIFEDVASAKYLGKVKLDGRECHHVKFFQDDIDWELWVDAGDRPLPLKAVVDATRSAKRTLGPRYRNIKAFATFTFEKWQIDTPLPDETFVFTPPKGVAKSDGTRSPGRRGRRGGRGSRRGRGMRRPGTPRAEPEDEPPVEKGTLLGKPAPPLEMQLLGRGRASLTDHKDKDVVVLCFWRSQTNDGRKALSAGSKIAGDYADKNVVVYAIGTGERPVNMVRYARGKDLKCHISLDFSGAIASRFKARAPTMIVIDKFGVVQSAHTGPMKDIEQKLKTDLEAVLAGKQIAPKGKIDGEAVGEI